MGLRKREYLAAEGSRMRSMIEDIELKAKGAFLFEKKSSLEKFKDRHGIVSQKISPDHAVDSIGFSDKEQKWYGWSHRAIFGFGVGDRIFQERYGDDRTHFKKHGLKTIENMDDAKKSAIAFARSVA